MALVPFGSSKRAAAKKSAANPMPKRQRGTETQDRSTSVGRDYGTSLARGGDGAQRGNSMPKRVKGARVLP